jgi:hypothetical protein
MGLFRRNKNKNKKEKAAVEEREGPPHNTSKDIRYANESEGDDYTKMEEPRIRVSFYIRMCGVA